jgi:hypothetical protein
MVVFSYIFLFLKCHSAKPVQTPHSCTGPIRHGLFFLVDLLAVEGDTEGAEQQSAISVVCSGSVDGNVEPRNHLGRVPFSLSQYLHHLRYITPKLTCHS